MRCRGFLNARPVVALLLGFFGLCAISFAGADAGQAETTGGANDAGWRDLLAQRGLAFGVNWIGEGFDNFDGGKRTGVVGASTLDFNVTLDTDKAFGWPGGKLYADLEDHAGKNPSEILTGDLQVFDKYNSRPYFQMFELYYEQKLFHDVLRLKLGKIDANSEFSVIDNGLDFIDSSTQVTPTLLAFPTTPDPLPSADVFLTPCKYFFAAFSASLANQRDRFLDFYGSPASIQPTRGGALLLGEVGLRWEHLPLLRYDGNLKFGFWGQTGTFQPLDGGTQQGAEGFYAVFDQTLWKPTPKDDETRGVRMFLVYGETDPDVSDIWQHAGGGLTWTGFLPERPGDEIGFSPQCAWLSGQAALTYSHELIFESFYKTKLTSWASLQPDLQYIVHPGGQYSNALVGMVLVVVQF